ncbi:MAG TPA: hypothetical protein VNT32_11375 [Thermoleophilaceae bacterium]|nr:hypothetical protein [Thermoleophilaceae bacterium]
MRKLLVLCFAVGGLAVPFTASAHDVPDGADCRAAGEPSVTPLGGPAVPGGGEEADRGQACVNVGGTTVFYIGGEVQPEEEGNPAAGGLCGTIIAGGTTVTGNDDWDNEDAGTHCD